MNLRGKLDLFGVKRSDSLINKFLKTFIILAGFLLGITILLRVIQILVRFLLCMTILLHVKTSGIPIMYDYFITCKKLMGFLLCIIS